MSGGDSRKNGSLCALGLDHIDDATSLAIRQLDFHFEGTTEVLSQIIFDPDGDFRPFQNGVSSFQMPQIVYDQIAVNCRHEATLVTFHVVLVQCCDL